MATELDHYYDRAVDAVEQAEAAALPQDRAKWLAIAREYVALIRTAQHRHEIGTGRVDFAERRRA